MSHSLSYFHFEWTQLLELFVNVGATAYECDDQQIAVNADIRLPPYLSLADVGPLGINWYATNVLRSNSSAIIPDSWVKGGGGRGGCLTIQMGQKCFKLPFHTHFSDSNDSHFPSQTVTYPIKSESLQNWCWTPPLYWFFSASVLKLLLFHLLPSSMMRLLHSSVKRLTAV